MSTDNLQLAQAIAEDFDDFFENSLCGYAIADADGIIIRSNAKLASWLGEAVAQIKGRRFSDLLPIGGKIYYETHLWPLLRMQGYFDEVTLELPQKNGDKLRVLVNAYERRAADGSPILIRYTIFKAADRLQFEQNLQSAKRKAESDLSMQKNVVALREQFIAILGHDLRNPLAGIMGGTSLLARSPLSEMDAKMVAMIKKSGNRMAELIENIMDFARTRLGAGVIISRKPTMLTPILEQVIEELRASYPTREIDAEIDIQEVVDADGDRIAQLLSNLLANALTHGAPDTVVRVKAIKTNDFFEMSVSNEGKPISTHILETIFEPFTREAAQPSQNGLGLGLFIAAAVSRAHGASLTCTSSEQETRFSFQMPLQQH